MKIPSHLIHQIIIYSNRKTALSIFDQNAKYREFLLKNQFFLDEFFTKFEYNILYLASVGGYLNIIKWLHYNKIKGNDRMIKRRYIPYPLVNLTFREWCEYCIPGFKNIMQKWRIFNKININCTLDEQMQTESSHNERK